MRELLRAVRRRAVSARPRTVLACAWLYLVVFAFPGQMTLDSFDHLREARSGIYSDAHPPFINALWAVLDAVVSGPILVLLIQATLFLAGLYFVLVRWLSPRSAAWSASAVFLFPPVMLPMAVIWKDCLMAGGMMCGLAAFGAQRRWVRVLGIGGMFLATAVRYNAFAATFVLVILMFEWTPGLVWWKRYAISLGAWLATTFAAFSINGALTDKPMHYWHSSVAVFDIVGTLALVDDTLPDADVQAMLAGTELIPTSNIQTQMREMYSPRNFMPLITDEKRRFWNLPTGGYIPPPQAQLEGIEAAWQRVVTTYPGAYAKHRCSVMGRLLGLTQSRVPGMTVPRDLYDYLAKDLGIAFRSSRLQYAMTAAYAWLAATFPQLWKPWVYLVIALFLLPLSLRNRQMLALLLSGIGMESTLLFLAPSNDFRYSYWLVIGVAVAAIVIGVQRYRRKPPTD